MRITNKIIQKNNLSNINTNKIYQDKLSTQMSTQKKINRPSDDPVVAIRALRLRSSVTEVTQYYSKNIPDADSWLTVTEDALKNLSSIVTDMIKQCTKGSNGDLTIKDRQIILEQLKALGDEVYATGDADYAGRYVFTGYRTDTPLSFQESSSTKYTITEQLDNSVIDSVTKVETGELKEWNTSNYNKGTMTNLSENDISTAEAHRIRLSYSNCSADKGALKISFQQKRTDGSGNVVTDADGHAIYDTVTWPDASGGNQITMMNSYDSPDPYATVANDPDALIYVPDTGELLLGENRYNSLMAVKDDPATTANEKEIKITYQKESWEKGDLRPEHYFYCTAEEKKADGTTSSITYNEDYLTGDPEKQEIEYDVGFNQTIRVNSTADECFKHGINREVDDLVGAMQEVLDLEAVKANMEGLIEKTTDETEKAKLEKQLAAANKALTYAKDKCQKMFEGGITAFQGHLDATNLSITNCGTRSKKLELIEGRMQNQKTTFEELKSQNEDVDIAEVAIQLTSAEMTYEAALMASGKVMQTTLLNFI